MQYGSASGQMCSHAAHNHLQGPSKAVSRVCIAFKTQKLREMEQSASLARRQLSCTSAEHSRLHCFEPLLMVSGFGGGSVLFEQAAGAAGVNADAVLISRLRP
jgi:hypothetical protein